MSEGVSTLAVMSEGVSTLAVLYELTYLLVISLSWHTTIASTGPALYKTGPVDCHRVTRSRRRARAAATSRVTGPVLAASSTSEMHCRSLCSFAKIRSMQTSGRRPLRVCPVLFTSAASRRLFLRYSITLLQSSPGIKKTGFGRWVPVS